MNGIAARFRVTPLCDVLGAEISDIGLHQAIDPTTAEALHDAWLKYHVLLIRGQKLTAAEHRRFCRCLGEIQIERTAIDVESKDIAGMLFVSNTRKDAILPKGDMWFHSDQCYFDTPGKATSLYAIETPTSGGHTRFANCHLAYDTLSDWLKSQIDGLVAMNCYDYPSKNEYKKTAPRSTGAHRHPHPVVRTHPDTGRKALYVNRLMTDYIVAMDDEESRALLEVLFDHTENPGFIYEHKWHLNDLLIWDNRCLVHGRTNFNPSERRLLRRFALQGDRPR